MLRIRKILHPTDFSDCAMQALQLARSLARDHGAKLVILAVALPVVPVSEGFIPIKGEDLAIEEMKERTTKLAASIDDVPVEHYTLQGIPSHAIDSVADELKVDLIVMGTQGRTGLSRWVTGSVAEYVIRHSKCPVLAVKSGSMIRMPADEGLSKASV